MTSRPATGLRDLFLLRPGGSFLNHGSFGACPRGISPHGGGSDGWEHGIWRGSWAQDRRVVVPEHMIGQDWEGETA